MGLAPEDSEDNQRRALIARLAESSKLDSDFETSILDRYAKAYSLDPDFVYQKEFDTVFLFIGLWKREGEYADRYRAMEKTLTDKPK